MKTLIITVEDTEEEIFDRILSVLNAGKNVFKSVGKNIISYGKNALSYI